MSWSATPQQPLPEILSRMWIECDPNRHSPPGSGDHADDPAKLHENGEEIIAPRWRWFEPRAAATIEYLRECGYEIVKIAPADID